MNNENRKEQEVAEKLEEASAPIMNQHRLVKWGIRALALTSFISGVSTFCNPIIADREYSNAYSGKPEVVAYNAVSRLAGNHLSPSEEFIRSRRNEAVSNLERVAKQSVSLKSAAETVLADVKRQEVNQVEYSQRLQLAVDQLKSNPVVHAYLERSDQLISQNMPTALSGLGLMFCSVVGLSLGRILNKDFAEGRIRNLPESAAYAKVHNFDPSSYKARGLYSS